MYLEAKEKVVLSIISIGINEYPCSDLENISCAHDDAKKMYDAFKSIMNEDFLEHASVCLLDITASDFVHLLNSLKFSFVTEQDTMVLYFSGHACNIKQYGSEYDFSLLFSDYNERLLSGYVSLINDVIPLLNKMRCNLVLILDCCYSGEGLKSATSIVGVHQISVISATSNRGVTGFSENGSELANAIEHGIRNIKIHNEDFTLNKLQQSIQAQYPKAQINIAAGKFGEIYLKKAQDFNSLYYSLKEKFLCQIQNGGDKYREALWYSISDIPEKIQMGIFEEYFHCLNEQSQFPVEVNWLVRRAIGSAIALLEAECHRRDLVYKLIESQIWQEQCIGIIGARYDIKNSKDVYKKVVELVSDKVISKIDAVWLANLYVSDNPGYDYRVFLDTSLMDNSWGIQEVYKTAMDHGCSCEEFQMELEKRNDSYQEWFQTFHNLKTDKIPELWNVLNEKTARGRLPANSKAKFILSALYGNWRGYKLVSCDLYFNSKLECDIRQELRLAKRFPEIEYRMALFEYFISKPDILKKYSNELSWGLDDSHPWVRRTAIQAFKATKEFSEKCNQSIFDYIENRNGNIGELDLYIEFNPNIDAVKKLIEAICKTEKYSKFDVEGVRMKIEEKF